MKKTQLPKEWHDHLVRIGALGGKAKAKNLTSLRELRDNAIKTAKSGKKTGKIGDEE